MNRPKVTIEERQQFLDELQVALNRRKQMNDDGVRVIIPKKEPQTQSVPWTPKLNHVPFPAPKPSYSTPQNVWAKPKGQVSKGAPKPQQNTPKIQITLSEEQRRIEEEILNIDREAKQLAQVIQEQHALHSEEHSQEEDDYQPVVEGKMEADLLPPPPCFHDPSQPPVYEDVPEQSVQEPQPTQVEVTPEQPTQEASEHSSPVLAEPPVLPILPPIVNLPQAPPKIHVDKSWKRHTISELKTDNLIERPQPQQHVNAAEKKKKRHSMDVKHLGQRHVEEPETTEKKKKGIKKLVNIISKAFA